MKLTVVIPAFNRADQIGITIQSLAEKQMPASDYEILVVDNKSTDNTAEVVRAWQGKTDVAVRYLYEDRPGVHFARNTGALDAKGEFLYYTDDDMIAEPGMLPELMRLFAIDPRIGAASGRVLPKWLVKPPRWVLENCLNSLLSLQLRDEDLIISDYDTAFSCHQMIRKSALLECGGFNPENTGGVWVGDGETGLGLKLRGRGYKFAFTAKAVTYHMIPAARMTQDYLHKRMTNQGFADAYTWYRQARPDDAQLARSEVRFAVAGAADFIRSWRMRLNGHSAWRVQRARVDYYRAHLQFARRIRRDQSLRTFVLKDDWIDHT